MSRWIIGSNRLPFKYKGEGRFAPSSGGLVAAIGGIHTDDQVEKIWIGGAPEGLNEAEWRARPAQTNDGWQFRPVFTDPQLYDAYYNGFCNDVLWPLLHYQNDLVRFKDSTWSAYVQVNKIFADTILENVRPDDLIWIHDFHFFLLPQLLKRERPDLKVGFFLHVPFPNSEVFRQLPAREAILESLLASDLVGFHDYSYLHHFSSCLSRILGLDAGLLSVKHRGHSTRLGVFPVSIDTPALLKKAKDSTVINLERRFARHGFTFLGVDRLDYIKGLDLKLLAFRNLLQRYPEVRGKVSLLQVAVPTREGSPEFAKLYQEISRLVGEINGEFSRPDWTPVHYMHASVSFDELMALYKAADALLVTSKRDGMNLVALEYIVAQTSDHPGVVLLSEFTGALSTLSYTLPLNPWNLDETADKMKLAMEMPKQEKVFRLVAMTKYLEGYTATDWAQSFLNELKKTPVALPERPRTFSVSHESIDHLADLIAEKAIHRQIVLLIDYDGTLVQIAESPELASLPSSTRECLRDFKAYSWLRMIVVSGRDNRFMTAQLGELDIELSAEHGASYYDTRIKRWHSRVSQPRTTWYPAALKILSDYTAGVPRSQIEKKRFSLSWHYRQSPSEHAAFMARKIAEELETGLANLPVTIVRGHKLIEVRSNSADKGVLASWIIENRATQAFPLAIGDDRTDEDMFLAVKGRGLAFRIGIADSDADYIIESQTQVLPFLSALFGRIDALFHSKIQSPRSERLHHDPVVQASP